MPEEVVLLFWYHTYQRLSMTSNFAHTDIFSVALGLESPWVVTNVEMLPSEKNPEKMEVHIHVDYDGQGSYCCPLCGLESPIYDSREKVWRDRKSTRLNSSHVRISYAVFCLKKKKKKKKST